jgi:hypothetical protein
MDIEDAVSETVVRHLETELAKRGLLLTTGDLAAAEAEVVHRGRHLLRTAMEQCYPVGDEPALELEFGSAEAAARIAAALTFGAQTAHVLAPVVRDARSAESIEVLCAIFNLGIGLVDGLCDHDEEIGLSLLGAVDGQDLVEVAETPRRRGWLRAAWTSSPTQNHTAAFAVEVIETFFQMLHAEYDGDMWLQHRRAIGAQLAAALAAERASLTSAVGGTAVSQLLKYSRLTSVIPFEVVEALVRGESAATDRTAGTLLGEAMWRIDDLVDLGEDARSGALNAVLLAAEEELARSSGVKRDPAAALERLVTSTVIGSAAREAAENLLAGLQLAAADGRVAATERHGRRSFLYFIHEYAGLSPAPES